MKLGERELRLVLKFAVAYIVVLWVLAVIGWGSCGAR